MKANDQNRIRTLIERLGRIIASDEWANDINPTQWAALSYLAKANRFSRSPSQVAEFLAATRGTTSQTLKALARKELIREVRSEHDKRSISYDVTNAGLALLDGKNKQQDIASLLNEQEAASLLTGLETITLRTLKQRGMRSFGICRECAHHQKSGRGGYCKLLDEQLSPDEVYQNCHEHALEA